MMRTNTQKDCLNLCRTIGQLETNIINLNQSILELKSSFDSIQSRVIGVEKQNAFMRGCVGVLLTLGGILGVVLDHISRWIFGK